MMPHANLGILLYVPSLDIYKEHCGLICPTFERVGGTFWI